MLGSLIKSAWCAITGRSSPGAAMVPGRDALQTQLRIALGALLREPPARPKNIDYEMVAQLMAAASSAEYMVDHMMVAQNLVRRDALLQFALDQCSIEGLVTEFGVCRGASLHAIARRVAQEVHRFDSFEGLPYFQKRGRDSLQDQVPSFDGPNVRVHKGPFDLTLPRFLDANPGPVRFVHIDCDIYALTRTMLELLKPRIVSGTVMVFDEYLNYPAWREHEYRAFQEYVSTNGVSYHYIGFASSDCAVAIAVD